MLGTPVSQGQERDRTAAEITKIQNPHRSPPITLWEPKTPVELGVGKQATWSVSVIDCGVSGKFCIRSATCSIVWFFPVWMYVKACRGDRVQEDAGPFLGFGFGFSIYLFVCLILATLVLEESHKSWHVAWKGCSFSAPSIVIRCWGCFQAAV